MTENTSGSVDTHLSHLLDVLTRAVPLRHLARHGGI